MGADLRHAIKSLLRMPVLTTVVVVSLGIGIGVNTAVFSWLEALVLAPLPGVRDAGGLRVLEARTESGAHPGMSWSEFQDLGPSLSSVQSLLAAKMVAFNVGDPGRVERTSGMLVSANYFQGLGLDPAQGRFFAGDEGTVAGSAPVVVISDDFWKNQLGGAADAVGRVLRLNDRPLTIIGIAPARFQGTYTGLNLQLFVPATMAPVLFPGSRELTERGFRGYQILGRAAKGANATTIQEELNRQMERLASDYPATNRGVSGEVLALSEAARGPQRFLVRALTLLQAILLLLLLAVCGNTATLLLARASNRRREMGVRLAIGSGPWRVTRLLLVESLLLGTLGSAAGVALAIWGSQALRAVPLIAAFPIRFQTGIDAAGLGFAALLGIVSGLIFGTGPALQLVRTSPQEALRSGTSTAPTGRLHTVVMTVQVALATIVLVAAGVFYVGFRDTRDADPGFRREGVLLAAYDVGAEGRDTSDVRVFTTSLLERLRALPGVEAAAIAGSVPLDIHGLPVTRFSLEGRARDDAAPDETISNLVTPGYFAAMGLPLLAGRDLRELDDRDTVPEVVVNQAFVDRFLEGGAREPLGRALRAGQRSFTIVGVTRTSVSEAFGEPPTPAVYFSYRDRMSPRGEIHLRTAEGREGSLAPEIRRVVAELDPMLPVYDVRTLNEHVDRNLFLKRIPARMFAVLGPLILALAAVGIYAVVAYAVAQRTGEIGIRMALGATGSRIVRQMVVETMQGIGFGVAAGAILALTIGGRLSTTGSVPTMVAFGIPALILGVGALSCWFPARRASRVDAMDALRRE